MQISLCICALVRQKGLVIKMRGITKRLISITLAVIVFAMCAVLAFAAQEKEPNDTIVTANSISVNTDVYGTTNSNDREDWYKFTISQDGYVWIDFTHDYGRTNHFVRLYYYDGYEENYYWNMKVYDDAEKDSSPKKGLPAGTYYVSIERDGIDTSNYSFKVNFKAANDWEKEFNDSIATPNTISVGKTVYGSTHLNDTYDWYKFTINQDGYVWIDFTHDYGKTNHFVYLYYYDGYEKSYYYRITTYDDVEKKSSPKQGLSAGTYYVLVQMDGVGTSSYSFKVNFSTSSGGSSSGSSSSGGSSSGGSSSTPKKTNAQTTAVANRSTTVSSVGYTSLTSGNAETRQNGNFYYYIDVNYNIVINNYSGSDTYVEIPSEIDGKPVVGIADNAFAGTTAQVIYVPSSVTQFGKNAFGQDNGESREIMCEEGSCAQSYANSNGITNETVKDENEASKNAASKRKKAEKKSNESKKQKLPTSIIIIICVALASCIAIVVVIIVMNRKKRRI